MDIYEYLYERAGKGMFSKQTFLQRVGKDPFVITEEEFEPDSETMLEDMSLRCLNCFPNRRAKSGYQATIKRYKREGNEMVRRIFFFRLYGLSEAYAIRWKNGDRGQIERDAGRNLQHFRYSGLGRLRCIAYYWTVWQVWSHLPISFTNKIRRMLGREAI